MDNVFAPGNADGSGSAPSPTSGDAYQFENPGNPAFQDILNILERSWRLLLDNMGVLGVGLVILFGVAIVNQVVNFAFAIGIETIDDPTTKLYVQIGGQLVMMLVFTVVNLFFQMGFMKAVIELDRGHPVEMGVLFEQGGKLLPAIVASLIVSIAVGLGIVLLIVPGVILALGLAYTIYLIVDDRAGMIDALPLSWEITDGYKVWLFIQGLILLALYCIVLVVTCCFGAPVAVAVLFAVQGVTYNSIVSARAT